MVRVTAVTGGTVINSTTFGNALITDYLSQTDTTNQTIASNVTVAAGKYLSAPTLKGDIVSEVSGGVGVTVDGVKLKDYNVELSTGKVLRTLTPSTLAVGATAIAVTGEVMVITGDGGGNTIATITGGATGQILILRFVDASVVITDDATHAANSVNLSAAFTSADNTMLTLLFDGTSWFETGRSVNG